MCRFTRRRCQAVPREADMTLRSRFIKHVVLPAYKRIRGNAVYDILDQLEKVQWCSAAELQERQWQKLQALLQHASSNVPYYRQLFQDAGIDPRDIRTPEDFRRIPYLTKTIIREHEHDLKVPQEKLFRSSTSGSTGERLTFFIDHREAVMHQALFFLGMGWAGLDIGEPYAKLWGLIMGQEVSRYRSLLDGIKNWTQGCLLLSVYELSERTLPVYINRMRAHKPKLLESYVSPLRVVGEYLAAHPDIRLPLDAIVTSSETLFDSDRAFIEETFGCPVFNRYGSREFGNIAHECDRHQGLHIYTEHAYIECLQNDQPARPGEKGELVVTSLSNYGMPFIRYRIGDYGEISDEPCDCGRGFPLLKSVDGRVFDIVVAPNGRLISGTYWSILFGRVVKGILQFQLLQEQVDQLDVKFIVGPSFEPQSLGTLEERIHERCGSAMKVRFELVDDIPLTAAGKRKWIISKVPVNFSADQAWASLAEGGR